MITFIDSNILIDIFIADPIYGLTSAQALRDCFKEGSVFASEIVWIEVGALFHDEQLFMKEMGILGIEFAPLDLKASLKASEIWRKYRQKGEKKERVVADFIIGAQSLIHGDRLLTRDRGFYRDYFKKLTVLEPK